MIWLHLLKHQANFFVFDIATDTSIDMLEDVNLALENLVLTIIKEPDVDDLPSLKVDFLIINWVLMFNTLFTLCLGVIDEPMLSLCSARSGVCGEAV